MNTEPGLQDISELYKQGQAQQAGKNTYTVDRLVEDDHFKGSYLRDLPQFEGMSVIQLIENLGQKGTARLLDVGCGKGNFLISMSEKYGKKLKYDGISTYPYHDEQKTQAAGVNIEIGDIQRIYRRNMYDLIVAEHSLEYAQNPLIALKRIYDALKEGGIALLSPLTVHFSSQSEENKFVDYMSTTYGFTFAKETHGWPGGWKVAFRKTSKKLSLPVKITKVIDVGNDYIDLQQLEYQFSEKT